MGNPATFDIIGLGKIVLKMTTEKELTLVDVLHVPDIRKNLISGSLLSKARFRPNVVYLLERVTKMRDSLN